jgi:hypothetical protein
MKFLKKYIFSQLKPKPKTKTKKKMEDQNQTILKRIRITWRNHACVGSMIGSGYLL